MFRNRPPKLRRKRPNLLLLKDGKPIDATFAQFGLKAYAENNGQGGHDMFFCRGEECPRGPASKQLSKHRCQLCIQGLEGETVTHILERIKNLSK